MTGSESDWVKIADVDIDLRDDGGGRLLLSDASYAIGLPSDVLSLTPDKFSGIAALGGFVMVAAGNAAKCPVKVRYEDGALVAVLIEVPQT